MYELCRVCNERHAYECLDESRTKKRYTVENPPRVYELAMAIGLPSSSTIDWLRDYDPEYVFRTPSHKVPLGHAIRFLQYMKADLASPPFFYQTEPTITAHKWVINADGNPEWVECQLPAYALNLIG